MAAAHEEQEHSVIVITPLPLMLVALPSKSGDWIGSLFIYQQNPNSPKPPEERGSWGLWKGGIRSVGPPIPIRLVTFVSALFAKGILVLVDEVAVPGEEIVLF